MPWPKQFSIAAHPLGRRNFPEAQPKLSQGDEGTISLLNGPDPSRVCFDAAMYEIRQRASSDT